MHKPELLLPASSLEVLKIAVLFGADAVYVGGELYSLRANAKNFSKDDLKDGVAFAHQYGKKVYVTANIFAHNDDLEGLEEYFLYLSSIHVDAVLISDPGIFQIMRRVCPDMPVHISTQANNTNYETFLFWYALGVRRIVCARELSLREIAEIKKHIPADMEIEAFVHGAMCISYSGRCLLSNIMTGRDANKGACTHPCRWEYDLTEKTRPNEPFTLTEDAHGSYVLNSKDLCMIEYLPEMIEAGIASLKIEGRMKNALYVALMAKSYRRGLDLCMSSLEDYEAEKKELFEAVSDCTHRPYFTGFFLEKPSENGMIYDDSTYVKEYTYLGYIEECTKDGYLRLTQKNKFSVGDTIELFKPKGDAILCTVLDMLDEYGNTIASCPHSKQKFYINIGMPADKYDILRKRED